MPTTNAPRAAILSGHGRWEDRWHDLPATSHAIAGTLTDAGFDTTVLGTWPRTLDGLGGADSTDLLVVNASCGLEGAVTDHDSWELGFAGLRAYLASGRPVVGIHTACNTFHDVPEWLDRLGGAWVAGTSMHPPIGTATVRFPSTTSHPITDGLGAKFDLWDERYSHLDRTAGDATVLATHDLDGSMQPLVWARDTADGRTVYDALGHSIESYRSPERRRLLQAEARWAVQLA